ncbi:hypothetical protein ACUH7Y_24880 [Clostridium beijerinckii]|uniref:Uncharacterized protein n=1 Tax=Clostridium beijerinckii TaxID=1520 RepID=A0A7X9SLZ8_CLOBE|nr:hypothetical protein [Clostridium beijerinckii]NMF04357.1 hypothetical protein [Clostridium beijerinckii]
MTNNVKTIEIDGKQVKFKSTAATPLRYKKQFGKDYFTEILKLKDLTELKDIENQSEALAKIDFEILYNIIWVLAKTADRNIPEPLEWLDSFDIFSIGDILPQLQDIIVASMFAKK